MTSWNEIRKAATAFSKRWRNAFDEKSQAQSFLKEFFAVFGVDAVTVATFEHRVKFADGSQGYADCLWPGRILVEMKSRGKDLDAAFQQAMGYVRALPDMSHTPRAIVVSDFARVRFYDLADDCALTEFALKDFRKCVTLFGFMIGADEGGGIREQNPVNRRAAEKMARLHDAMKSAGYTGHPLEVYLVRLLFCLFAEDTGIFRPGQFSDFIAQRTASDGHDLAPLLALLFDTLNRESRLANLDESVASFPYVNGGLFAEPLPMAAFSPEMRRALLDCGSLDWAKISPAIFGAMFQGVMDEKTRHALGAHYTSEENILRLIRPLFLDGLRTEFEAIKNGKLKIENVKLEGAGASNSQFSILNSKRAALQAFHEKIASLTFLDPACGCGNFLLIAYRELRRLEMDILEELHKDDPGQFLDISQLCKVSVSQFHGIEIEPFPAEVAKVALWLMDHLCNMEVADRFGQYFARIPIRDSPHIVCANALTADWPRADFIMGNPPFNGARTMTTEAKKDLEAVFGGMRGCGNLDFVTAWFKKASDFIQGTATKCAFVATNSITQGEQVPLLWKSLNVEIDFAYRTFKWHNEAKGVAAVHCVIIGFHAGDSSTQRRGGAEAAENLNIESSASSASPLCVKTIFDSDGTAHVAKHISGYLIDAPDAWVESRSHAFSAPRPLIFGSMPNDGGFLSNWSPERRAEVVARWPDAAPLFHRLVGSDEPINGIERWCLWLKGVSPAAIRAVPPVMEAVAKVRELRLASNRAATRRLAATPMLFGEIRQPESGNYLLIPKVSSEKREYIPMAFFPADVIASDLALIVPGATLYDFGVLTSRMHMAWMRTVAGRLKSDYRYSAKIVYNNFPWPCECKIENGEWKMEDAGARTARPPILNSQFSIFNSICAAAQMVLDARAAHPESTLADLYDPLSMPPDLVKAHAHLDALVDKAYGLSPSATDADRVSLLFKLYADKVREGE